METLILSAPKRLGDVNTETSPDLDPEALAVLRDASTRGETADGPLLQLFRPAPGMGRLWSNIGRWVFVATAVTAPFTYSDPRQELRRSGASSITWAVRRRRGQPISLAEARKIAFQILAETETRLNEEREAEARFVLGLWDEEDTLGE